MKLCSACLLGVKCEWDGKDRYKNENIILLSKREILIPVCPEQLGGLPTPREPCEILNGDGFDVLSGKAIITDKRGKDKTDLFLKGAQEVLYIAKLYGIKEFIGKEKSPSCGVNRIYDGTFSGRVIGGTGVTTALLRKNKIKVISEEDIVI